MIPLLHGGALFFLILIPVILVFYLMKLKRKDVNISCAFLWRKTLEEAHVDSFFHKLRVNVLLLLQVLFIILVTAALARPYIQSWQNLPPGIIFILDSSASMQALEDRKTRFNKARDRIAQIAEGARRGTSMALITATTEARLELGFTTDKQEFMRALKSLSPQDTSTRMEPAFQLAMSLIGSSPQAQIFLFSDGGGDLQEIWPRYSSHSIGEIVGKSKHNAGITAFNIRQKPGKGLFQAFVTARNSSQEPMQTFLILSLDGNLKEARELRFSPGEEKSFIFDMTVKKRQTLEIRLDTVDGLALDNRVFAVIDADREKHVLLLTKGNPFLEKLLSLMTGCDIRKASPPPEQADLKKADLVIWDEADLRTVPDGFHLFINCTLPANLLPSEGTARVSAPLTWDRRHPVNSYLDFSSFSIVDAARVKRPAWGKTLLSSADQDLMLLLDKGAHHSAVLAFSPYQSDLYLSPLFPMLIANICTYFLKESGLGERNLFLPEETIPLNFRDSRGSVKVTMPGGTCEISPAEENFADTGRTGIYTFKAKGREYSCAVNLLDEKESSIAPKPLTGRESALKSGKGASSPMMAELWRPIALAGLLLLLLEWSCYHRRRQ